MLAFLERPPLCLLAASALAEPPAVLRMQLTLVHGQIVSLLTASAISGILGRSPGYDLRKLLGGWVRLCGGVPPQGERAHAAGGARLGARAWSADTPPPPRAAQAAQAPCSPSSSTHSP